MKWLFVLVFVMISGLGFSQDLFPETASVKFVKTIVYETPSLIGNEIGIIYGGDSVEVIGIDAKTGWYKIIANGTQGFVIWRAVAVSEQIKNEKARLQKGYWEQANIEKEQVNKEKEQTRKNELIKKYGKKKGTDIGNGIIRIGYTKQMVLEAWGKPYDINRTVSRSGTREQWIYGKDIGNRTYLYIENGILTTLQD